VPRQLLRRAGLRSQRPRGACAGAMGVRPYGRR
jgi:hypothetical protein